MSFAERGTRLKRITLQSVVFAAIVAAPLLACAQADRSDGSRTATVISSSLPLINGLWSFNLGKIAVSSGVGFGWKHVGLNYSVDIAARDFSRLDESPLEVILKNTAVWEATVDFNVKLGRKVSVLGSIDAGIQRKIPLYTPLEPANANPAEPAVWRSSGLEWWQLAGGIGYQIVEELAVVAGLKHDHLQLELRDPINVAAPGQFIPDDYTADFRAKTWIPYIGAELRGSGYTVSLLASSIASISFKVPFRYLQTVADDEQALYSLMGGGYFLEGTIHYIMLGQSFFHMGLWAKASLMRFQGTSREDLVNAGGIPLERIVSGSSTYSRHEYALGINARFSF